MATEVPVNGVITTSGEYYLASNRTSTGTYNIKVEASNVDLNLNGKIVQYSGGSTTDLSIGVNVAPGKDNVRVRNGAILGSQFGINAGEVDYLKVEEIDFTGVRYCGVSINPASIAALVRRCKFANIAGWTAAAYAIGVNGVGINSIVEFNTFKEIYRQAGADSGLVGEGCAVLVSAGATGAVIRQNWFDNGDIREERDIAIWIASGGSASVYWNTMTNFGRGVIAAGSGSVDENRLIMREAEDDSNAVHVASGSASNNVMVSYETPESGGGTFSGNTII